ncbi:MAG: hypothetical protein ACLPN5_22310 [Roseiarcus sp.]
MAWRRLAFAMGLLALVAAVRLPFLDDQLIGEEGIFAFLVANPTLTSRLSEDGLPKLLVGNLDGVYALGAFQHAIGPYVFLERVPGAAVRALAVLDRPPAVRIVIVRAAFLALYLIGAFGLAWLVCEAPASVPALPIALYGVTAPLAVGGSIQPQVDGGYGVMIAGIAASLLLARSERGRLARFLIAGVVVGLGRAEWAIAFAAAAAATLALALFAGRAAAAKPSAALAIGLALGVAASFAYAPQDYLGSFRVAGRVIDRESPWTLALRDWRYLVPLLAMFGAVAALGFRGWRRHVGEEPGLAIVAGAGAAIFAGFAMSGWPGDGFPRYYAPALMLAAYAAARLALAPTPRRLALALTVGFAGGLVANAAYLIGSYEATTSIASGPGLPLSAFSERYAAGARRAAEDSALTLQPASIWLTYPKARFIGADMGYSGAAAYLREHYPEWVDRLER